MVPALDYLWIAEKVKSGHWRPGHLVVAETPGMTASCHRVASVQGFVSGNVFRLGKTLDGPIERALVQISQFSSQIKK